MDLIDIARKFLEGVKKELDPHTTRKGEIEQQNNTTLVLWTPDHIQFAKYGRGPGKQPPVDPLIKWVKKKGIVTGDKEAKGTAWAIAKSIAKNGTNNWVKNAPNALNEAIKNNYSQYLGKASEFFAMEINNEIADIEMLPESIKKYKI